MKPTTPLLLAVLTLASLSGCASRQEESTSPAAAGAEARPSLAAKYASSRSQDVSASILRKWKRPPASDKNARALVDIEMTSDGDVVVAEVTESDGDAAFNESVVQAVYRTSPLPTSDDPREFTPNVSVCISQNPRNCR